jgi:leukotriene-A4 hydrolase
MILGRELIPIQDTPAIKFYVNLGIKVIKPLIGMISGIFENVTDNKDGTQTFYYKQKIPIPSYLIALVAGNIKNKTISNIISVYSEPEMIDYVYNELIDMDKIMNISQNYMGEYKWEKYNILVLPKSFPISGIENPCLKFCFPCIINGDKSLIDIVIHELINSWSGNLVTNENWSDFWLNEGITMFLQRKIISMWKGADYSKMDGILGLSYIDEYLDIFGNDSTYTTLRPNFDGVSPDDFFSDIPYEKGYNLIYYIESLVGEDINMKDFFQSYFARFKYQSIDVYDFINYFKEYCRNRNISEGKLDKIKWEEGLYKPGKCPVENNFTNIDQE